MRLIVGLGHPTGGTVTVNGRGYDQHRAPLQVVGALLEAKAVHSGRSADNHLLAMGATHGIGKTRVKEVIEMTGLETVAKKRVRGF
jgi:ABC-2 type transport system ATP-binding protein